MCRFTQQVRGRVVDGGDVDEEELDEGGVLSVASGSRLGFGVAPCVMRCVVYDPTGRATVFLSPCPHSAHWLSAHSTLVVVQVPPPSRLHLCFLTVWLCMFAFVCGRSTYLI